MIGKTHFLGDNPINNVKEDLFNFKHYAEKVQKLIQLNSDNPDPITIGIYGKWGEGKTSLLNLIENKIEHFEKNKDAKEYLKYHFNPWRYSNEDEMLFEFFDGLAKMFYVEKKTILQKIGNQITRYSKYLKAIKISTTIGIPRSLGTSVSFDANKIFEALGEDLAGEQITLESLKNKVNDSINDAKFKVIVFIDDIDRLDKNEIYTILKLIKLNASFNNFIFIVSLDIDYVSKAIKNRFGEENNDGKMFLEKIINIPIHVPRIEQVDLKFFFESKLFQIKNALNVENKERFNEAFKEINGEFSGYYFESPREIIRTLNSFFISAFAIGDEVNLRDLFWIEYIKIKNEKCYNTIKNYSNNTVFVGKIIDFNDSIERGETPNGMRKHLMGNFNNVARVIDFLFPTQQTAYSQQQIGPDILEKELRINFKDHFEKYFSFHIMRKFSANKIIEIEKLIAEKSEDGLITTIENLFLEQTQQNKVFDKIEFLIKNITVKKGRNFFYEFMLKNISIIPESGIDMFGLDYKLKLIELIGSKLSSDSENDNKEISLRLSRFLDLNKLCHYSRKFKDSVIKPELIKLISDKAENEFTTEEPFYLILQNSNKMIMHYWKETNHEAFDKYIKDTLISEERIGKLIRNFPGVWNNAYIGALEYDNYSYLKELINVDFIYDKLSEFNPVLVEKINDKNDAQFDDYNENSEEDNLKQFIFWYKFEKLKSENKQ
ncbi:KAP family P-loop NTPase fold protein [Flavobacterium microcysteis]|uniref:KAP NTPase domain-containing protein n=1 Tax=Flavobacterium microcysteis TaxID=2596891 RepID=A0A501Q8J3_9FLAO|nr:P-loop NTPase fold protein [Flavobacterium microcysteis]TPD68356.1 hypothetical protein FJA49_09835 [Flavobacterium microcysteis]